MWLLLMACSGGTKSLPSAEDPSAEVASKPEPEATPDPVVVKPDPVVAEQLGEALAEQTARQRAAFEDIATLADFVAAFEGAAALCNALQEPLQAKFEAAQAQNDMMGEVDVSWLLPNTPALIEGYFAEGTAIALMMKPEPWMQAAKKTPSAQDDDFLTLMAMGYDNPGGVGWPSWSERNWDYGGCSTFGSGQHFRILEEAQRQIADRSPFLVRIQQLRSQVLGDILNEASSFAYCDVSTGAVTPAEKLKAEGQKILDGITLSEEEMTRLKKRIETGFPLSD